MALVKTDTVAVDISGDHAESGRVVRRDLVGVADGAPNFTMREFQLSPGAATPHHSHDWEHEVLILEGAGMLLHGDSETPFAAGNGVYVPANEMHQFQNTGAAELKFICVVTNAGHLAGLSTAERAAASAGASRQEN